MRIKCIIHGYYIHKYRNVFVSIRALATHPLTPCSRQDRKTPVDCAKNDEIKAVFAKHADLLAAQAGTVELAR